jgi:NaMN:DMB phosphoribosyltransferase
VPACNLVARVYMVLGAAERIASLAKPPGSLGTLEEWAETLCTVQGTLTPAAAPQTVLVFCNDAMWNARPRCGRPAPP